MTAIYKLPSLRLLFSDRPIAQTNWSKITTLEIRSPNPSDLDRILLSLNRNKQPQIWTKLYPLMHKLDRLTIHIVSITSGTLLFSPRGYANETRS